MQAWLNGSHANDGIALVGNSPLNATFDSKESTSTSHAAELDIVFAAGSGGGITGITTASGSGLIGGGTSGNLNLSLTNTCAAKQILQWSGSAWACASPSGSGTVTSVGSGAGLTGGPITTSGTLSIATAGVVNGMLANPSLTVSAGTALTGGGAVALGGTFSTNQTVNGTLTATSSGYTVSASSSGVTSPAVFGFGEGLGVVGSSPGTGVEGEANSTSGIGVYGFSSAGSGTTYGVYGWAASDYGYGVYGTSQNIGVEGEGANVGVYGTAVSSSGIGASGATPGANRWMRRGYMGPPILAWPVFS